MAKTKENETSIDRAKRAVGRIDAKQAAVAGAGVAAGLAIGAALFANWRKTARTGADAQAEPQVDYPADEAALAIGGAPGAAGDAVGAAAGTELDPDGDADKLRALGTPTTMPVDGGVQRYTGEATPDMAIDYLPEADVGSTDAADTRGR
jgi:uncharacterized membrane protein